MVINFGLSEWLLILSLVNGGGADNPLSVKSSLEDFTMCQRCQAIHVFTRLRFGSPSTHPSRSSVIYLDTMRE